MMKKALFLLLLSLSCFPLAAQECFLVEGRITNQYGFGMEKAGVRKYKAYKGTSTDVLGYFSLYACVGDTLVVSYVGFQTKQYVVQPKDSTEKLVLRMNPAITRLPAAQVQAPILRVPKDTHRINLVGVYSYSGPRKEIKPRLISNPISKIYETFSPYEKGKRKLEASKARIEANEKAYQRVISSGVLQQLGIPREQYSQFLYFCDPDPNQVMQMKDYDLMVLFKECKERYNKPR